MAPLSQVARVESPFFAAHSSPTRKKTDPYLLLSSWATGALTFSLYLSLYSHRHQRWFSLMRISPQFHYSSDAFIDQIYFNRFASTQYNLQKNRKMRSTGSKNEKNWRWKGSLNEERLDPLEAVALFKSPALQETTPPLSPPPLFHHIYCIYVHYTIYIHSRKEKRYLFSTNRWADGKKAFPRSEIEYISVHVHIDKKRERKSKKKHRKRWNTISLSSAFFFPRVYLGRRTIWCNLIYACDQLESSCIWILKGIII